MNSYKIPDEITRKVNAINSTEKTRNKLKDFFDKLESVSNAFSVGGGSEIKPEKVNMQKMDFVMPTQTEIIKQSENSLKDYKDTELKNIQDNFKLKSDELDSNKQSAISTVNSAKENLNQYYNNAKTNAESQALKRGLARSSIIVNQLGAFDKEKLNDYKRLDDELNTQINAINFELNALNGQKQKALNDFNVSYAVKLQDKINSLTDELNKKQNEVIKYNNEIVLKEAEFNKSVDDLNAKLEQAKKDGAIDLTKIYGEYGQNVIEKVKSDQIYNMAKEMLHNLELDEINWVLSDTKFKSLLGDNYIKIIEEFA